MPVNIEEKIKKLSPERRKKVETRAKELIAEEISLRELRKAHRLTQECLAQALGIGQEQVSRLEHRSATFCFRRCAATSKPWAANLLSW